LSDSALALIKSFMRQVGRVTSSSDQIASIGWVTDQKSKRPDDAGWIDQGAGWVLGAYSRAQVPPDVIDNVGGIEIIFSAKDPSTLTGKIVDADDRKLFVRD